jgi:hypothetical protein
MIQALRFLDFHLCDALLYYLREQHLSGSNVATMFPLLECSDK